MQAQAQGRKEKQQEEAKTVSVNGWEVGEDEAIAAEFVGAYDVIWLQWVCTHFTDACFIRFLRRCAQALKRGGGGGGGGGGGSGGGGGVGKGDEDGEGKGKEKETKKKKENGKNQTAGGGLVCIKENVVPAPDDFEVDDDDSSVTRSRRYYEAVFAEAGFRIVRRELQEDFPEELFEVYTWALEPVVSLVVSPEERERGKEGGREGGRERGREGGRERA